MSSFINERRELIRNAGADIEKFVKTVANISCKLASNDILKFAEQAMVGYYAFPKSPLYDRTEIMLMESYKPFCEERGKGIMAGGVDIDTYMEHFIKGITEEEIYDLVWRNDIHGFKKSNRGWKPTYGYMTKGKRDQIKDIEKQILLKKNLTRWLNEGLKQARKGSYKILDFSKIKF